MAFVSAYGVRGLGDAGTTTSSLAMNRTSFRSRPVWIFKAALFSAMVLTGLAISALGQVLVDGADQGPDMTINASAGVDYFSVGQDVGTTGVATIAGTNTIYSVSSSVQIGNFGTGTLNLED